LRYIELNPTVMKAAVELVWIYCINFKFVIR
jgi:hypothetical protein